MFIVNQIFICKNKNCLNFFNKLSEFFISEPEIVYLETWIINMPQLSDEKKHKISG